MGPGRRIALRKGAIVKPLEPTRKGETSVARAISTFDTERPDHGQLQIIQGPVGSGKSLFIRRYKDVLQPESEAARTNELKSRMQMTDVVNRRKIRHAHMVNINKRIMLEGMRADFQKVDRLSVKVMETVRRAKQIRAKTPAGTDLVADLNSNYRWVKTSGIISTAKGGDV